MSTIKVVQYSNEQVKNFLLEDVKLSSYAVPDGYKDLLPSEFCLAAEQDGVPQALLRCNEFTPVSIMVHVMVSTKCQQLKLTHKYTKALLKHFVSYNELHKLITAVPGNCRYAERFVKQFGFKKEATLKNIMLWKGDLVDLHWYSYDLNQHRGDKCQYL